MEIIKFEKSNGEITYYPKSDLESIKKAFFSY